MKKAIFFFLAVSVLFIFGCNTDSDKTNTDDIHTGTQGVVMSFVSQNPPTEVFKDEPIVVLVEYSNKGASEVGSGKLYLTGYDPAYLFGSSPITKGINGLGGKTLYDPVGQELIAEFPTSYVKKPEDTDTFNQKLKLTACYRYVTSASIQVCIDPSPYKIREGKKICTVAPSTSLSGGQGAPVAITKVDELIGGDRIQFKVYFKNLGTGEVFNDDKSVDACLSGLAYSDMDVVSVLSASYSRKSLNCEPKTVRLINNEGYTICYSNIATGGDEYLTTLNIELQYNYRDSITRNLDILDVPGSSGGSSGPVPGGSDTDCGSKGCCASDLGGSCLNDCDSACPGQKPCPAGYCGGGTARKCCITGSSGGTGQNCGQKGGTLCIGSVAGTEPRTGSCSSYGKTSLGASSDCKVDCCK